MNDRDIIRVALITANLNGIDRDSFIVPDQSISGKTLLLDSFCFNNSNGS